LKFNGQKTIHAKTNIHPIGNICKSVEFHKKKFASVENIKLQQYKYEKNKQ
jgi:hypothetical protein